jgi:hypothetical protein
MAATLSFRTGRCRHSPLPDFKRQSIEPIVDRQPIFGVQLLRGAAVGRLIMKAVGGFVLAVALVVAAGITCRSWVLRQSERQLIVHDTGGVDEAFFVGIRGTHQWVTIRGRNRSNPVVIMIHGGPGASNGAFATDLLPYETDFTVVQWDQPGAPDRSCVRAAKSIPPSRIARAGSTLCKTTHA